MILFFLIFILLILITIWVHQRFQQKKKNNWWILLIFALIAVIGYLSSEGKPVQLQSTQSEAQKSLFDMMSRFQNLYRPKPTPMPLEEEDDEFILDDSRKKLLLPVSPINFESKPLPPEQGHVDLLRLPIIAADATGKWLDYDYYEHVIGPFYIWVRKWLDKYPKLMDEWYRIIEQWLRENNASLPYGIVDIIQQYWKAGVWKKTRVGDRRLYEGLTTYYPIIEIEKDHIFNSFLEYHAHYARYTVGKHWNKFTCGQDIEDWLDKAFYKEKEQIIQDFGHFYQWADSWTRPELGSNAEICKHLRHFFIKMLLSNSKAKFGDRVWFRLIDKIMFYKLLQIYKELSKDVDMSQLVWYYDNEAEPYRHNFAQQLESGMITNEELDSIEPSIFSFKFPLWRVDEWNKVSKN